MKPRVIAVIPAFNEAAGIADVVTRAGHHAGEVVVIDDGSTDATASIAKQAGARVIRHPINRGKGAAIITALADFGASGAEYAVFLDADGQHDPAEIPQFVAAADTNQADLVVGTRMDDTAGMPRVRLWVNWLTSWLTSRLARQAIPDSQCGYRLLRRSVLPDLRLSSQRFETETEMLIQAGRAGHRILSIPIRTIYGDRFRASYIRPGADTWRFGRLILRYWLGRR